MKIPLSSLSGENIDIIAAKSDMFEPKFATLKRVRVNNRILNLGDNYGTSKD